MSSLTGLVVHSQIPYISERIDGYNTRYRWLLDILSISKDIYIPDRSKHADVVAETLQFCLNSLTTEQIREFVRVVNELGV